MFALMQFLFCGALVFWSSGDVEDRGDEEMRRFRGWKNVTILDIRTDHQLFMSLYLVFYFI